MGRSRTDRFALAWVSVWLTEKLAQSGDTRHEAVEGHVQLARSEALGEQPHYVAVALHPWWRWKKESEVSLRAFWPPLVRARRAQVPTASSAELSSNGLMAPDESSSNLKKVDWKKILQPKFTFTFFLNTYNSGWAPADCANWTAGSRPACGRGWRGLWTVGRVKDHF